MALFFGGLAQFLAGMWEFATGNTFGATGESGTFHSISLHHTQVMAASAIIKAWTACHRMILCGECFVLLKARRISSMPTWVPKRIHGLSRPVSVFRRLADHLFALCSVYVLRRILALVCHPTHPQLGRR